MLLNQLIPEALKNDPRVFRSSRLIILIDLVLLCCTTLFLPFYWWIGFTAGAWIMAYAAVNSIIFILLMYYTHNFFLCGNFFCIQSWLVFNSLICFSGGTTSPFFMWLLSIPPIAIFYMRNRYAYLWVFLTIGGAVSIAIAQLLGFSFPQQVDSAYYPFIQLFSYAALLSLFIAVVLTFRASYKRINKKLLRTNEKLQRSNMDLERFAYVASHDLKSPLRNVIGFVSLFIRRFGQNLEPEPREYLDIAKSNALQMQNLIEDILEYSQTSNTEMKKEEVDLNRQLKLISDQLKNDPIYAHGKIEVWELPNVIADSARLHQLFQNLVENGLKYNNSKEPRVAIKYFEEMEDHYFVVEDNGIGISTEFHERIFKMFERLHNQENYQGTGIGLAICLKNVQEYGGSIWIESEVGKGSQFHIRFSKDHLIPYTSATISKLEPILS